MKKRYLTAAAAAMAATLSAGAVAALTPSQKAIQDHYTALARVADPAFTSGDAKRGETFFMGRHTGGKADAQRHFGRHREAIGCAANPVGAEISPRHDVSLVPSHVERLIEVQINGVAGMNRMTAVGTRR